MRSSRLALGLTVACLAAGAGACARKEAAGPRIETRDVTYAAGQTTLKGFIAWDAAAAGKRPGVLVVHEWWGFSEHERNQARRLAAAGYVALAVDMFGDGKTTSHPQEAAAFAGEATKDPATVVARFNAALEALKADPNVDPERIGAIGYCFGGMVVLSMARAGADLDAVASFHGALPSGTVDSGTVRAHVLIATGGADPFVPKAAVEKFTAEMEKAGAALHVQTYPNAKHGFTNPAAGTHGMDQLAYDAAADTASWQAMRALFAEVWP
jgi:dienelactone hydrolase